MKLKGDLPRVTVGRQIACPLRGFNLVLEVFPTLREALASVSPQSVEAFERR